MIPSVSSPAALGVALLKLVVFTLPGTAQFFASVGLPDVLAYPVFAVELIGGVALLLGDGAGALRSSPLLTPESLSGRPAGALRGVQS